jgi:SAM-dependent methyltransferase
MRKLHNNIKRALIQSIATPHQTVLDVGCGRGGDIFKWLDCKVKLHMCEPNEELLAEARSRCGKRQVKFYHGDVSAAPNEQFDIICYNFSFQYTFKTEELFEHTIREMTKRSHVGTKFIGIIPDSDCILRRPEKFTDCVGNYTMRSKDTGNGEFGETLWVCVKDTAYYENDEPIPEPIAYKDVIITRLSELGWCLDTWQNILPNTIGYMTDIYSEFIFTRVQ